MEILLVEDTLTQALMMKRILITGGNSVVHAKDGPSALLKLTEIKPDLILSDINMPEMDGYELCRQVKADSQSASIPFVLMVSLLNIDELFHCLECGADNLMYKSFDETFMLKQLNNAVAFRSFASSDAQIHKLEGSINDCVRIVNASAPVICNMLVAMYETSAFLHSSAGTAK